MRALKITNSITRRDEKSLDRYLAEIAKYEVLSPEEEIKLFDKITAGDKIALEKIVRHNLRFVVSVSKQYQHLGLSLGDLISEGNIGLMKAAKRFDQTRGFKFISYAVWWIRQAILQAVNEKSKQIRLPQNLKGKTNKIMSTVLEILQEQEREPLPEEIAEKTGFTVKEVQQCIETYRMCASLDAPMQDDSGTSLANFLEDLSTPQPDFQVAVIESQKAQVEELLRFLTPKQATVISMYYGIGRNRSTSLGDIAEQVGVSRERVRQIKDRSLSKMRVRASRNAEMMVPALG
ncbi:MAG: RNA polymerase sigma factor RpoD/SigA [Saprospiraceae bacterium]|nr:RNA polymerase sigma factor RpoD/SigA [Saprospiraceae bacterium]